MQKHLYFICPTDQLEPIINNRFKQTNFYLTSLGNSIAFDADMISEVKELLETENINDISFVLSDDNRFVSDALENKDLSEVTGLSGFYNQIERQKERSQGVRQTWNRQFLILSYHLNSKINELKQELNEASTDPLRINGMIYQRSTKTFSDIYSDLICGNYIGVN